MKLAGKDHRSGRNVDAPLSSSSTLPSSSSSSSPSSPSSPPSPPPPSSSLLSNATNDYQSKYDKARKNSQQTINKAKSKRPQVVPPILNEFTKWRYVGVCTRREAESTVPSVTEFRLYHQWDPSVNLDDIDSLPLTVIYRSSSGDLHHWLVRTMGEIIENSDTKQNEYKIRSYYIEHCGPALPTLNGLIRCYENRTYNKNGYIEVFRLP